MPDQTTKHITNILISLCARMVLPKTVHSDQGQNFESAIFHQAVQIFGVKETEWWNALTHQFFKCCGHNYVTKETDWE